LQEIEKRCRIKQGGQKIFQRRIKTMAQIKNRLKRKKINIRISDRNDLWLEKYSEDAGITKSQIISMAIDNFIQQKDAIDVMGQLMQKITAIEEAVKIYDKEEKING